MSYQDRRSYDAPPPYYVEPMPTVIIQTVGDCPACHVGYIHIDNYFISNSFYLGRIFTIRNDSFGCTLLYSFLSSWNYLFIFITRRKMFNLWIHSMINSSDDYSFFQKKNIFIVYSRENKDRLHHIEKE
jgi:hypothetical protein